MEKTMIYNVSIVQDPDDNGMCMSFTEQKQAEDCATWARNDDAYSVIVWTA